MCRSLGLHDDPRPDRPRTYDDENVAQVIRRTLHDMPATATHWSTRLMAAAEGVSSTTLRRWLRLFGTKPRPSLNSQLRIGM